MRSPGVVLVRGLAASVYLLVGLSCSTSPPEPLEPPSAAPPAAPRGSTVVESPTTTTTTTTTTLSPPAPTTTTTGVTTTRGPTTQPAPPPPLVDVRSVEPTIMVALNKVTDANVTGAALPGYEANRAFLQPAAATALADVQRALRPMALGLKVYATGTGHSGPPRRWSIGPEPGDAATSSARTSPPGASTTRAKPST